MLKLQLDHQLHPEHATSTRVTGTFLRAAASIRQSARRVQHARLAELTWQLPQTEYIYRQHYLHQDKSLTKLGILLLFIPISLLIVEPLLYGTAPAALRWSIPFLAGVFSLGTLLCLWLIWRTRDANEYNWLGLAWTTLAVITVLIGQLASMIPSSSDYGSDFMSVVLLFCIFLVFPNRAIFQIIPAALLITGSVGLLALYPPHALSLSVYYLSFFTALLVTMILGLTVSFRLNHSRREQFMTFRREHELRNKLHTLAYTDGLTGLSNRRHIFNAADKEFSRYQRYSTDFSVIALDLDHFKNINDRFGHDSGDLVLQQFADLISAHQRKSDYVGRIGGEEFVLVLPETDIKTAYEIAERIRIKTHKISIHGEPDLYLSASLGVAQASNIDHNFGELLKRSDEALYRAKRLGRDRVCVDFPDLHSTHEASDSDRKKTQSESVESALE